MSTSTSRCSDPSKRLACNMSKWMNKGDNRSMLNNDRGGHLSNSDDSPQNEDRPSNDLLSEGVPDGAAFISMGSQFVITGTTSTPDAPIGEQQADGDSNSVSHEESRHRSDLLSAPNDSQIVDRSAASASSVSTLNLSAAEADMVSSSDQNADENERPIS